MTTFAVVMNQPLIQVGLLLRDAFVEAGQKGWMEEFIQDRPIEPFNEAVALRPAHPGPAMSILFDRLNQTHNLTILRTTIGELRVVSHLM